MEKHVKKSIIDLQPNKVESLTLWSNPKVWFKVRTCTKNPSWGCMSCRVGKPAREPSGSTRGGLFVCLHGLISSLTTMSQEFICTTCGHVGKTKRYVKGSLALEILLWLFLLVPGLIYSIWRSTTKERVCAKCKKNTLIPVDSPTGQKLLAEQTK